MVSSWHCYLKCTFQSGTSELPVSEVVLAEVELLLSMSVSESGPEGVRIGARHRHRARIRGGDIQGGGTMGSKQNSYIKM